MSTKAAHTPINEIPEWVRQYNDRHYGSGAGKAVKISLEAFDNMKAENQELLTRLDNITNTIELILGNTSGECPQGVNVRNFNALKLAYTEARETLKQLEK
jgi:hypothetical protein